MSDAVDAAIWDDPMLKRARRAIGVSGRARDASERFGFIHEGEGAGLYAVGTGGLRDALAEAMDEFVGAVHGQDVENSSGRVFEVGSKELVESELRVGVEGSIAGFAFESMSTLSESVDPETGELVTRIASRYRMRRGQELFACAQELGPSDDVDGRVKLQPGSMGFADVLHRVMEWEGANGARFSCVVVSGEAGREFEAYLYCPTQ